MSKQIFRKGDKVFHIRYGWGEVTETHYQETTLYPILVKFQTSSLCYTLDGKWAHGDSYSRLSFTEYGFDDRFSQERPINYKDYIGKWGKFWDTDVKTCIIDRLIECKPDDEYYFTTSEFGYLNFEPLTDEQIKVLGIKND